MCGSQKRQSNTGHNGARSADPCGRERITTNPPVAETSAKPAVENPAPTPTPSQPARGSPSLSTKPTSRRCNSYAPHSRLRIPAENPALNATLRIRW
jgi:hypothetical protein